MIAAVRPLPAVVLLLAFQSAAAAQAPPDPRAPDAPVPAQGDQHASDDQPLTAYVRSALPGVRFIRKVIPAGVDVVKGRLVCSLNDESLRDELADQQIATVRAEADLENAKRTLEVAKIDVLEYTEGIIPLETETVQGEIKLWRSVLDRTREALEGKDRGQIDPNKVQAAIHDVQRAELNLELAETKLEMLRKYTYERVVKRLEGDVEYARADVLAKESTLELEREREERVRRMIESCRVYAPCDGVVRYPRWVEEGASVHEGYVLFAIVPAGADEPEWPSKNGRDVLLDLLRAVQGEGADQIELLDTLFRLRRDDLTGIERTTLRRRLDALLDGPMTVEVFDALIESVRALGTTEPPRGDRP